MGKKLPAAVCFTSVILIISGILITQAFAVETGKISRTAEMTAIYRAIGAVDPDVKIRSNDTYAEKFIPRDHWSRVFPYFDFRQGYENAVRIIKTNIQFSYFFVQARTKHIDSILSESLKNPALQVVNLGAGYDSRAYRFHQAAPEVRYFEIDMPEMIVDKKERVRKVFNRLPEWVTYVPIDFNKQTLSEELLIAGFDKGKKTLFICEGVTMYISMEAVAGTFKFISGQSAPGSTVVFDYISRSQTNMENRRAQATDGPGAWGEPYIFGIDESRISQFLTGAGLQVMSDIGPLELTNRYLIGSDCQVSGYMRGYTRIAHAVVPDKK